MKLHCTALKGQARQAMRSARPHVIPMTLLYLLLTSGGSMLAGLLFINPLTRLVEFLGEGLHLSRALTLAMSQTGGMGLFFHILVLIATVVLDFGYTMWCHGTTKGGIGEYRDLLGGSTMVGRALLLRLTVVTFSLLWYMLLSMAAMMLSSVVALASPFGFLSAIPIFAIALGLFFWKVLHYSLADLCLMDDPDKGVFHAVLESRRLMRGHVGQFLLLILSFFGWWLLRFLIQLAAEGFVLLVVSSPALLAGDLHGAMAAAVAIPWAGVVSSLLCWPFTAWLTPYQTMTRCCFYNALRGGTPN